MKKNLFLLLFLLFIIPQSFCARMQPSEQPQPQRYEDLSLEQRQRIDQERIALEHDLQQLDQELPAIENELEEQSHQIEHDMTNIDLTPKGLFHGFQETVLIKSPMLFSFGGGPRDEISVGLYGKDLLKFAFMILDAYIDSHLQKNLFTFVLADFTKSLLEHKTKIAELLSTLTYDENNLLVWNDAHAELSSFIKQHGFKTFSYFGDLNFKKVAGTLVHLLISETSFGVQHQFFPPAQQGLLSSLNEPEQPQREDGMVISLNTILEIPLFFIFGISQLASSNAPALRHWLLTFSGLNHPFLDSYRFYLIKRLLIFTRFMKQNHEFYHKKFCDYFMSHLEQFKPLFTNKENVNESKQKEALQTFLKEINPVSFMEWFIYKNKCCYWTDFLLELAITSPALYTFGKSLYNILYPTRGNA